MVAVLTGPHKYKLKKESQAKWLMKIIHTWQIMQEAITEFEAQVFANYGIILITDY